VDEGHFIIEVEPPNPYLRSMSSSVQDLHEFDEEEKSEDEIDHEGTLKDETLASVIPSNV
jgi:hypothetical protein